MVSREEAPVGVILPQVAEEFRAVEVVVQGEAALLVVVLPLREDQLLHLLRPHQPLQLLLLQLLLLPPRVGQLLLQHQVLILLLAQALLLRLVHPLLVLVLAVEDQLLNR